ncbi:MAG: hypothetical protein CVU79_04880 [Elusimicrobia bacterium HGW-Elusimicrobia-3]|nr:MAG: hypothetical protein CVU79_04880 [Elusimicrobia bacterium HGW-Elusimicrobia-3]
MAAISASSVLVRDSSTRAAFFTGAGAGFLGAALAGAFLAGAFFAAAFLGRAFLAAVFLTALFVFFMCVSVRAAPGANAAKC